MWQWRGLWLLSRTRCHQAGVLNFRSPLVPLALSENNTLRENLPSHSTKIWIEFFRAFEGVRLSGDYHNLRPIFLI